MKKSLLLLLFLGIFQNFCLASDVILDDAESVQAEFEKLKKIEDYVNQNEDATLESMMAEHPELLTGLKLESSPTIPPTSLKGSLPGNIPPFAWGCCLGVIGVAAVYFTSDNDKEAVKKSVFGCLVNGLVLGGGCLAYSLLGGGYYY